VFFVSWLSFMLGPSPLLDRRSGATRLDRSADLPFRFPPVPDDHTSFCDGSLLSPGSHSTYGLFISRTPGVTAPHRFCTVSPDLFYGPIFLLFSVRKAWCCLLALIKYA